MILGKPSMYVALNFRVGHPSRPVWTFVLTKKKLSSTHDIPSPLLHQYCPVCGVCCVCIAAALLEGHTSSRF